MQKIKNLLHHNQDANHNGIPDSQERTTTLGRDPIVHDHGTTIPNTIVPPATSNVASTTTTTTSTLSTDRNHNGIPDQLERGNLSNDRNMNGIPDNLEKKHHNPLDRNHDGKVTLADLKPSAKREAALNDRNNNGIPDNLERGTNFSNDRNMNGIPDNLEGRNFNDRNMNGIPDNLESGSSYGSSSSSYVRSEPTVVQVVEKGVVVHEHIHPVEKEEIQPVIYREREQLDVKQITQQLHETQIQPTLVQQRELAAEYRAPVVERGAPIQENIVLPSVDRDATMRSVQVNAAIVNETIKRTVIEEVQPVLERDVFVPTIVQETKPIYEKIVEAPHVYRETLPVRELGTVNREYVAPVEVVREVVVPAPAPALVQPVTVVTTTTTTDSFIPAKLVGTDLKGHNTTNAPAGRKVL